MNAQWFIMLLLSMSAILSCNAGNTSDSAVNSATDTTEAIASSYVFPYNLENPVEKLKLPDELMEISGIDFYQHSKLVCVQDENGSIYIYDVNKAELKEVIKFGSKGDYEGVANVNDTIWVLSSNGNLQRIDGIGSRKQQTIEFKTPLDESNDTEGLCFDRKHRRLLIACKNKPGSNLKGTRAIYAFDLKTNTISTTPVYSVKLDDVKAFLAQTDAGKLVSNELRSFLDPESGDLTFQPSEIHVHPITDQVYILASAGSILLVLNRDNTIQHITQLNPGLLKQPEGLTFMKDGTMFISDEGRDGRGNILKFNYLPHEK